jgi:replicative DNA helicase
MQDNVLVNQEELKPIYETQSQQRCLLKYLFTNGYWASKLFMRTSEALFDKPERVWLFKTAKKIFLESNTLISKDPVLESALSSVFTFGEEDKRGNIHVHPSMTKAKVETEWACISGASLDDYLNPEFLLGDLEEKKRAAESLNAVQKYINKVSLGDSDKALDELLSYGMTIKSSFGKSNILRDFFDEEWRMQIIKERQEHPELFAGMKSGFPKLDMGTGGFFRREITLIGAHTGVGKSTFGRALVWNFVQNKHNVLLVVNEETEDQTGFKLDSFLTGIVYKEFKNPVYLDDEKKTKWVDELKKMKETAGGLYILQVPEFSNCSIIESSIVDLKQKGIRLDIVVLDYLDHLKPIQKAWSEINEQNLSIAEFKGMCIRHNVCGITSTQADTKSFSKEKEEEMTSYDVRGSKQKAGASNVVLFITRINDNCEAEAEWKVQAVKNRDGMLFKFFARVKRDTRMVYEIDRPEGGMSSNRESDSNLEDEVSSKKREDKEKKKTAVKRSPVVSEPEANTESLSIADLAVKLED